MGVEPTLKIIFKDNDILLQRICSSNIKAIANMGKQLKSQNNTFWEPNENQLQGSNMEQDNQSSLVAKPEEQQEED